MLPPASTNFLSSECDFVETSGHTIPETLELDLISEEISDNRIHTPPPRIAARFYRPTSTRRKSSAASSRRSSTSSMHSHQSASRHAEPQSSFIAQHQRRASIIEDKKARLADRAAHVDKVRLRAAFFKATPRSNTNREERALAAQQAREKNLAEIVATCAEEVKRAKGIAESMREKREADGRKLRKEMEERLAEAERRRGEILNRGGSVKRGRSLSQSQKSSSPFLEARETIGLDAAALRIQMVWRAHQARKSVKEFQAFNLSIKALSNKSFDEITDLLEREHVLLTTARILRLCGLKDAKAESVQEMATVRSFLSAFLIMGHPEQTLSNKIEDQYLCQELVNKARALLLSFETILTRLNQTKYTTLSSINSSEFSHLYTSFFTAFIAWKARDSEALINILIVQFTELETIWLSVKSSSDKAVAESYKDGIRSNQIILMARIKRLAGEKRYKQVISQALKKAHASHSSKKSSRIPPTQKVEQAPPTTTTTDDLIIVEKTMAAALHTLTPPSPPQNSPSSHVDTIRFAQPPMQGNRIITHEIAIDKEYRIGEDVLAGKSAVMQSAFENMRRDIASGNSDIWILAMAENVRAKLQKLLTEGKPLHSSIGEWLDHDLIATKLRHQSFSCDKFFEEMGHLLPKLCAPFRDSEIQAITQEKFHDPDIVSRLEALMYALDILQLDYANFLLQRQIPLILANAAKYETYQFMQQMSEQGSSLRSTEMAWMRAREKVMSEISRRDPENIKVPCNDATAEKVYSQMLVDTFTIPSDPADIPETLKLDQHRILRIRTEVLRIVTCGAILLQCKNLLKREVRSLWKTEATRIYTVLENTKNLEQAAQGIQAALESSRSMPNATKTLIRNLVNQTITASESTQTEPRDPVLRLLLTRLRGHILIRVGARTEREKHHSSSTAGENLTTLGLPEFAQKVGDIVHEILRVATVDREAHGQWYEQIIEKFSVKSTSGTNEMEIDPFPCGSDA
ncbi:IQ calmodulin-binding motif domain protein [Blumeria hordei DH14]|uniref:IQ calmodulin-binding motif domain protein n=1 Tax=Blumeria graminis f. sp. hordei (strain DH14) TaxID=546991 RepID=N1JJI8_BLUG1|nr:IQ calmodulin-binding motif domain protein [Blumeria hordei DH14]